jgi:precorrin-2 dehydrogenase/sirohydrochlorin ferrochelatase
MAREIRKKIEKVITKEDILQLDLQYYTRKILKDRVEDQKNRKSYLYKLLEDDNIKKLLNEGKIKEAKSYVDDIINSL